ncbi:hypothetical protein R21Y_9 [Vibrio phage vB_VhaS_R21Y]|nr:hypothetical protein R21Y_9 [Vibrio phage vB_VhaS_R21Y]
MLNQKWRELIKKNTGEDVKAFTVGENQLLVKVSDMFQGLNVMGFFTEYGKAIEVREEGLLITLD